MYDIIWIEKENLIDRFIPEILTLTVRLKWVRPTLTRKKPDKFLSPISIIIFSIIPIVSSSQPQTRRLKWVQLTLNQKKALFNCLTLGIKNNHQPFCSYLTKLPDKFLPSTYINHYFSIPIVSSRKPQTRCLKCVRKLKKCLKSAFSGLKWVQKLQTHV